jgi:hypothetical protein
VRGASHCRVTSSSKPASNRRSLDMATHKTQQFICIGVPQGGWFRLSSEDGRSGRACMHNSPSLLAPTPPGPWPLLPHTRSTHRLLETASHLSHNPSSVSATTSKITVCSCACTPLVQHV